MKLSCIVTTIIVAAAMSACSSSEGIGIDVRASTSTGLSANDTDLLVIDDGGGAFALETARLRLRHIELDLPDGSQCSDLADDLVAAECDDDPDGDKIHIPGPFDVDLMTGESTPSLASVVIPAGMYKRIDFRVEDGVDEVAFAATALFERDGETLTLDLSLDFNEDIRIEEPAGTQVTAESNLIAQFVVDDWLAGVDIGACMDDGDVAIEDGTVSVDDGSTSGSCSDIENIIKVNMKESGQLDRE